jgi:uncharacterized coiled-coil protein SlyX
MKKEYYEQLENTNNELEETVSLQAQKIERLEAIIEAMRKLLDKAV